MPEPSRSLINALYPALLFVFLGLYVAGVMAGSEPELAMLRAGGACLVLALVGRFAAGILGNVPPPVAVEERDPEPTPSNSRVGKE